MPIESHFRTRSIGARLTLLLTLLALAAMMVFAVVADWRLSSNFGIEHLRFLQAKTAELHWDLRESRGDPRALIDEITKETTGTRLREYLGRVIGADGRMLSETPGMRRALPESVFPPAVGDAPSAAVMLHFRKDGHSYVLTTVALGAPGDTAPLHVQIALDTTDDEDLLVDFRRTMALVFLTLIPLLVIAGRWVVARGLLPVTRITRAARSVTPAQLSERIPLDPPWPAELRDLVQVFNAMLTRLEEAFARLSRFSADLAHELRTPLSNLSGEFEVCLMNPRSAQDYRATLESGLEECRRLNGLVENLLFIARAEHAGLALRHERFDAAHVCAFVIAQQAPGAAARGIAIRVEGNAAIDADVPLFRQALTNLLTNAIRYSNTGGEVRVALLSSDNGSAEVRVIDRGEGIEARHLPHLFDRFYQADAARRHDAGRGTGLGLSIVKTIVELHGGKVSLESTPGAGTVASMQFPSGEGVPLSQT
ncbi:MAG: heavy metal sensor histidine kinase [Xanthomonadaceae bacterium]|nr:heavy metal sensor histidine kinase [Xanthomonadaceae bacterium]